jgi:hypothetical protein
MRISISLFVLCLSGLLAAQCYPDRHNTTWFDAWISCETTIGPVASHGESHWIQYDLGHLYLLGELEIWNINDPLHLDRGAQTIHIDVSEDGEEWTAMADQTLNQGSGLSIYEGQTVMDFDGAAVRYLLLTIESTYGADCGGISEMRVGVEGVISSISEFETPNACFEVQVYPNPHYDVFNARIESICGGTIDLALYDATGRLVQSIRSNQVSESSIFELGSSDLPAGIYYLSVQQDDALGRYQIIKTR